MTEKIKNISTDKNAAVAFPEGIRFKYEWRQYQKKVLSELESHLSDNHLHVVAPPGSGKTVLGLEVALRINKPTLVLTPTIAIRNQWIDRFCELFLQTEIRPEWVSDNLKKPGILTVSTYQSLHAACTHSDNEPEILNEEEEEESGKNGNHNGVFNPDEIIKTLKKNHVGTIVVDEAHHLKNEWWGSLTAIAESLEPSIVGLTATPPYDVTYLEWERYIELNGDIDAEISVPELIIEHDLCPHQDYVLISSPTEEEKGEIAKQKTKTQDVFSDLLNDDTLITALRTDPAWQFPDANTEWIYDNLESFSAVLIFLNAAGVPASEKHLKIIGNKKLKIPSCNYEWMEILLSYYLYGCKDKFQQYAEHQQKLINKLSYNGLLDRKTVNFRKSEKINKLLGSSLSKLKSIDRIADIEHNTLKDKLRMVILTDFIRKEFLVNTPENNLELNKIGVIPIFEQLRRTNDRSMKLGVLSGSVIIIPSSEIHAFEELSDRYNISDIDHKPLPYDNGYLVLNITEELRQHVVKIVTDLFENGNIQILIGTKSLLGEGWDAPAINSLILASFVGSFVLSNQMRGRAIRTDRNNPEKTGNIWHLVCVDNTTEDGGEDLAILKKRFAGFVGVSNNGTTARIENGTERLGLPSHFGNTEVNEAYNDKVIYESSRRHELRHNWEKALKGGVIMTEEIKIPFPEDKNYHEILSFYTNKTMASFFAFLLSGVLSFAGQLLEALGRNARNIKSFDDFMYYLMGAGIVLLLIFGRMFIKALRMLFKYRDISKDFQRIGEALLETYSYSGLIQSDLSKLKVVSSISDNGAIYCHLEGGTTYEKSMFIRALHVIAGPVRNPRYVIIRKNKLMNLISQKDYHSVPEELSQNKKYAHYFSQQWWRLVGACELVFTRTPEGRQLLLKSRLESLASEFQDKTERINRWK